MRITPTTNANTYTQIDATKIGGTDTAKSEPADPKKAPAKLGAAGKKLGGSALGGTPANEAAAKQRSRQRNGAPETILMIRMANRVLALLSILFIAALVWELCAATDVIDEPTRVPISSDANHQLAMLGSVQPYIDAVLKNSIFEPRLNQLVRQETAFSVQLRAVQQYVAANLKLEGVSQQPGDPENPTAIITDQRLNGMRYMRPGNTIPIRVESINPVLESGLLVKSVDKKHVVLEYSQGDKSQEIILK